MDIILKYTLKKIQEQTSQIPNLNYGGCCHFAKLLAKELENRSIKFKTGLMDHSINFSKRANKAVRKRANYLYGSSHVCLKIGKYYVDGEQTTSNLDDFMFDNCLNTTLTYKDLKFYSTNHYWNSSFNKRKYHPVIAKIIKNQFKLYDKLKNEQN